MAGNIKTNSVQLGDSATATQNFVLQTNVDGTAKLARGNVGATTQDILTVDAAGKAAFPQGLADFVGANQQLAASGYQKLPGGLIIQWGLATLTTTAANTLTSVTGNFPIPFTQLFKLYAMAVNTGSGQILSATPNAPSNTQYSISGVSSIGAISFSSNWFAIGI